MQGDLRSVRLPGRFDAVLIHDAIMYMASPDDLLAALSTARAHVAPGGAVLVLPDFTAETYQPGTDDGGSDDPDGSGRGVRWLEWHQPLAPGAHRVAVDYLLLLRDADGSVRSVHDRHDEGVFPRDTWQELFARAGFGSVSRLSDPWRADIFLARP